MSKTEYSHDSCEQIISDLRQIISDQKREITARDAIIADLKNQAEQLKEKIEKIERTLGLNSSNSGKPPSSDGLKKPPRVQSLREKSDRKPGGQPGRKGSTLRQVESPDTITKITVDVCSKCDRNLSDVKVDKVRKCQVIDIPEDIKLKVNELQFETKCCPDCKTKVEVEIATFNKAPVQYGKRIKAVVAYLGVHHLMPDDRLSQVVNDLFGAPISPATIQAAKNLSADYVSNTVANILKALKIDFVKGADETSLRVAGKNHWAHTLSNEKFSHYRISEKRGDITKDLIGVVCHDHFAPYYSYLNRATHAVCNAHHLRELTAVEQIDGEPWAKSLKELLLYAHDFSKNRRTEINASWRKDFNQNYDKIIFGGLKLHEKLEPFKKPLRGRTKRRPGNNLLLRLQKRKDDVLRFLDDERIPFTNNLSEQALRMIKVKQKISGGFRTFQGAQKFLTLRSYTATAQKQGNNIFDALLAATSGKPLNLVPDKNQVPE